MTATNPHPEASKAPSSSRKPGARGFGLQPKLSRAFIAIVMLTLVGVGAWLGTRYDLRIEVPPIQRTLHY